MKKGFFDKADGIPFPPSWVNQLSLTGNHTITPRQNGFLFDNAGATGSVTFTLPSIRPGYYFGFFVHTDQNVTIASATPVMMVSGIPNAISVSFDVPSERVGSLLHVYSNSEGTYWIVELLTDNAYTVTF